MTPILLFIILGGFQVGLAVLTSIRLTHAAQQGAVAGAADPEPCVTAQARAADVYGSVPDDSACSLDGDLLELRLTDAAPVVSLFGAWNVQTVGRAVTAHGP